MATNDRPREARALQRDRATYERLMWPPLSGRQVDVFMSWWRENLVFGGAWFVASWPSPRGAIPIVRRFLAQPSRTYIAPGMWQWTATCETRGLGELPQAFGPLIQLRFAEGFLDEGSARAVWNADGTPTYVSTTDFIDPPSALYVPLNSARLITPYDDGIALAGDDFTIEFWVRPISAPLDGRDWLGITGADGLTSAWSFYTGLVGGDHPNEMAFFWVDEDEVEHVIVSSIVVSPDAWVHFAATRRQDRISLWQDGVEVAFATGFAGAINQPANSQLTIGKNPASDDSVGKVAYWDMVRVFRGRAIYTAPFTPPTRF